MISETTHLTLIWSIWRNILFFKSIAELGKYMQVKNDWWPIVKLRMGREVNIEENLT